MIALGIAGILGTVVMNLTKETNKTSAKFQTDIDASNINQEIIGYLSDQATCSLPQGANGNFGGVDISSFPGANVSPFNQIVKKNLDPVYPTGAANHFGSSGISIVSYEMQDTAADDVDTKAVGSRSMYLIITFSKKKINQTATSTTFTKKIKISFKTTVGDSTNIIATCTGLGVGYDQVWNRGTGANLDDIYYSVGEVGIGTIAPIAKLDVVGGIFAQGGPPAAFGANDNGYAFNAPGDNDSGLYSSADGQIEFFTNSLEVMRVKFGNVGIGTINPGGDVAMDGGLTINGTDQTQLSIQKNGVSSFALNTSEGVGGDWSLHDRVGGSWNRSIVSKSGSIGINNISPNAWAALDVNTNGNKSIHTMDGANGGLLIGYQGSNIQARETSNGNNQNLILQRWGGNVGINTAAPAYRLDVDGDIRIRGSGLRNKTGKRMIEADPADGWLRINPDNTYPSGVAGHGHWSFGTGGVSVGDWSDPGVGNLKTTGTIASGGSITSSGAVSATGSMSATSFFYTSDRRLKENEQIINDSIATLLKLRPVKFTWKSTKKNDFGFIAQEVHEVIPEITTQNKSGTMQVDYAKIIPFLVEAIKEQQKRIEVLEKKLKDK